MIGRRQRNLLAFRLDLLRTLGLRHAVRRVRANARHRSALVGRRARVPDRMWREAAAELGAEVRELAPEVLEFAVGGATTRVRGQTTPFADPVSESVASDKPLAYRLLADAGLPVPEHALMSVRAVADAEAFVARVGGPCIVKPARGGGGAGVTGEVRTPAQLRRALVSAARFDSDVLLEHQVAGDSYRVLLLDGEVLDVIKRARPTITGDGRSTIEELMFREYATRIAADDASGLKPFVVDLDCLFTLAAAGRTIHTVLAAGEAARLKTATNFNSADESETLPAPYPEALIDLARRAATAVGSRLAGVDVVAADSSAAAGAVVLEVNATPGLTHHYNVADPSSSSRIAVPILAALLGIARPA
jgi:cyanophycin synthetase